MIVRTLFPATRRPRSLTRSRLTFLAFVWILGSILKEPRNTNHKQIWIAPPILFVEAVWYTEICHTGPRYKVRIDPISGKVVPVYPEGYVPLPVFGPNSNPNGIAEENDISIAVEDTQNSNESDTNEELQNDNLSIRGDDRLLRSNRLWRDFDEDSETDALVVRTKNSNKLPDFSSQTEQSEQGYRSLFSEDEYFDDLEPGEFYVKPCICQESRWTFPRDAGLEQMNLPPTEFNGTTENDWPLLTPDNSPNNFGLLPNNNLVYVQDNTQDADLYLCRAQAMYCGVLVDTNDGYVPIVKCYDQNMRHIIARNAWPLILLWYFGLAIICCCTVHGRTAGDYVQDRLVYFVRKFVCCFWDLRHDYNDRMLNRMIRDDERERRRRRGTSAQTDDDDDDDPIPWYFSNQRLQFERSLMAQVQWIWRHQEYMREISLREQGLPPPQLKLKVKRFRREASTSNSNESLPATVTTSTCETVTKRRPSNESTYYSSSSFENKDDACCKVCSDGDQNDSDEKSQDEFVTLDLGTEQESQTIAEESPMQNDTDDVDSLDAPTCAICFCAFEEGDRIGNLTCKHEFHIDCLKGWVQRKNACPLCNVRLGVPERPEVPPQENTNENSIDGSRHSLSNMMHWFRGGSNNNNNNNNNSNNNISNGAGEIRMGSRMGMIGAVSAAADITAAPEPGVRRGGLYEY